MRKTLAIDPLPLAFSGGKAFVVYIYRDPRRRKKKQPIYVGKGTVAQNRPDTHWYGYNDNPFLNRVLAKIRGAGLVPIIEIYAGFDNEADAFKCEIALIAQFGRRDLGTGTLCNLTDGGEGMTGNKRSPETRAKISKFYDRKTGRKQRDSDIA
jgi:hypothetical protein